MEVKSTIQNLEKEKQLLLDNIKTMEDELSDHKRKNQDWEHRFESEVSSLRKSIKQTEAKYNDVTSAPPKVSIPFTLHTGLLLVLNHYIKNGIF